MSITELIAYGFGAGLGMTLFIAKLMFAYHLTRDAFKEI
jgi:hypothetical protein